MRVSSNPNAKYNIIEVKNTITNAVYIGARMKDADDFRLRVNKAADGFVEFTALVESVRFYGDEAHTYKMVAEGLSYTAARKMKAELVWKAAKNGNLMMHQLLRGKHTPVESRGAYLTFDTDNVPVKKQRRQAANKAA